LESVAVDRRDEVSRLEMRIQELTSDLTLATETKTRLEMQCEESRQRAALEMQCDESRQRAALDADERSEQLQRELQVSFFIYYVNYANILCFIHVMVAT